MIRVKQFEPAHLRHHQVEKYQVDFATAENRQCLLSRCCPIDAVISERQVTHQQGPAAVVVVNDQKSASRYLLGSAALGAANCIFCGAFNIRPGGRIQQLEHGVDERKDAVELCAYRRLDGIVRFLDDQFDIATYDTKIIAQVMFVIGVSRRIRSR